MDKSTRNFAQLYWILSIILISIHSINAFNMCLSHVRKVDHYANRQSIRGSRGGQVRPIRTLITNRDENRLDQGLIHTQNNRSNLIQVKQDISINDKENHHANIGIANVRSISNKICEVFDFITSQNLDIFFASETWIKENDSHILDQVTPQGYTSLSCPRADRRGGGIAVICKSGLEPKQVDTQTYQSFEHMCVRITSGSDSLY